MLTEFIKIIIFVNKLPIIIYIRSTVFINITYKNINFFYNFLKDFSMISFISSSLVSSYIVLQ